MNYVRAIAFCAAVAVTSGAFFLAAAPALGREPIIVAAPPPDNIVVRHVSYADLNLAAAPGQKALNRRVHAAVTDLCTEATGSFTGESSLVSNMSTCSSEAWRGARPQIEQAILRAQQLASTGQTTIAAAAITLSLAH